jgi:histidinol-phosphate aminotransferase
VKLSVPDHIRSIPPYVPGKPIEEVERERGIANSVKLASNENPLGPSPRALEAVRLSLPGVHRYPDSGGYDLIRKLAAHHRLAPGNFVIGNGSDDIIVMLGQAFLQPLDEVIMTRPSFQMYEIVARSAGAVPVEVPLRGFRADLEAMAGRLTPQTRMVFINTPLNPTGTIVTRRELDTFLEALPAEVILVLDEAYIEFARDPRGTDSRDYADGRRPVVGLRTFSKVYGLAGLRIGYGIMPAAVAEVLNRVRQPFNVNLLAQKAAAAALDDREFLDRTLLLVHSGLEYLERALAQLGIECLASQANFLMVRVSRPGRQVFEALLDRGVIVRPLDSYGYPDWIRVNAGLPEENQRFIAALGEVLGCETPTHLRKLLITIDGPAGAGKTTVSRRLADCLGYRYIDTGALYRGIALTAITRGADPEDDAALGRMLEGLVLRFQDGEQGLRLTADGRDITDEIRTPEISMLASKVSARPAVRAHLLKVQRELGRDKACVFEGRDMGTVVFPQADLKFFLSAAVETRAQRRHAEIATKSPASLEAVARDLRQRDAQDSTRALAPLKPAADAICIDSTDLSAQQVVDLMRAHVRARLGRP